MGQKGTVKLRRGDMKEARRRLNDSSATMKPSLTAQLFHTWCLYAGALGKLRRPWPGAALIFSLPETFGPFLEN